MNPLAFLSHRAAHGTGFFRAAQLGAALLPASTFAAVAASLTPSTTSSATTTPVELHVTGIPVGALVTVERFADANVNGVVDSGEPLVESFTVTDGQDTQIAGVRNINIPATPMRSRTDRAP